jgi:microcompartment protein CcmK/EutM
VRLGVVRGHVVLNQSVASLSGTRLRVVEPIDEQHLAAGERSGGGKPLIVADRLGPDVGQRIAFVEGREAANPYWPDRVPVDAYCALIVDQIDFQPAPAPVALPTTGGGA